MSPQRVLISCTCDTAVPSLVSRFVLYSIFWYINGVKYFSYTYHTSDVTYLVRIPSLLDQIQHVVFNFKVLEVKLWT